MWVQKAKGIISRTDHILSSELTFMSSGWRCYAPLTKTNHCSQSFNPSSIRLINAKCQELIVLVFLLMCLMYYNNDVFKHVVVICLYRHTFMRASVCRSYAEILSPTGYIGRTLLLCVYFYCIVFYVFIYYDWEP